jgi:hypothetical protein
MKIIRPDNTEMNLMLAYFIENNIKNYDNDIAIAIYTVKHCFIDWLYKISLIYKFIFSTLTIKHCYIFIL